MQLESLLSPSALEALEKAEGGSEKRVSVPVLTPTSLESPTVVGEDRRLVAKQKQIGLFRPSVASGTDQEPEDQQMQSFRNEESATVVVLSGPSEQSVSEQPIHLEH